MKFKTYTGITWSLLELTGLLEDEESRVYFEKYKKHFGLHPFHLTNLNASLNEILSSNLNSYDPELKGFLLAYQNPKLLTPLGEIFYDTCFIHIDVEAEFYVFRPEVGASIKGIVNKKGIDHIGVLLHKAFNASIPKLDDDENWLGDNLEIGQEVKLVVTFLDLNGKLPFIRGTLDPDNYLQGCQLMENTFSHKTQHGNVKNNVKNVHSVKQNKQHTFFDSENSSDEDTVQIKEETPTQSSRKSFEQEEEEEEEVIEYNEDKKNIKKVKESKTKKKSRDYSSQSSIDEHADVKSERSPKKLLRRLSSVESEDEFRKIKAEISENINREQIKEEIVSESRNKSKKRSAKRKHLDETGSSADDFTADKYIRNSSKKTSKNHKVLGTDINGVSSNVKVEQFNIDSDIVEESPSKKKHKKQKNTKNIKEEITTETDCDVDEENKDSTGKKSRKKHSKKILLDISEIKVEPIFEDIIEIEKPHDTGSHDETREEQIDHDVHTNRSKKRNSVSKELKVHKAKVKKEKSVSNTISDEDQWELKAHKVNVKKEKSVAYSVPDEVQEIVKVDQVKMKKEKFVTNIVSDEDQIDTYDQYNQKAKKHRKSSPRKQSSESEVDHSRVKVKIEKSTNG